MAKTVAQLKGHDFAAYKMLADKHGINRDCPGCKKSVMTMAIVKLVYGYISCKCDVAPYVHLVEQIWHRKCYNP
jgi:hypothetical protein